MSAELNVEPQELRTVGNSPLVIFIVYTVGEEAEKNGYWEWLERVDSPFFNAIPGVRRYENWIVERNLGGDQLEWDYFDFQGIDSEDSLESVWFNPDLDGFRKEWIRLWGYGSREPSPILRHAYILRPVVKLRPGVETDHLVMTAGRGEPPSEGDGVFRVEAVLSKHFATGGQRAEGWVKPATDFNPLGFDWLSVTYADADGVNAPTDLVADDQHLTRLTARRIA